MASLTLPSIPAKLSWRNQPLVGNVELENSLSISAGSATDCFIDPGGNTTNRNAPVALFAAPDENLLLAAKVTVEFASNFDAGVLFVYESDDVWAKLCFEYSPQNKPTIVSVVTRGTSDDCNSAPIDNNVIFLRIYRCANTLAFHYSQDNRYWHLVRYFTLGILSDPHIGFSAQSPTGQGCTAHFSEISYNSEILSDLRNGE